MKSIQRKLLRDLIHLRGQMIAVVLVIACGISALVSMATVYDSLLATRSDYYERYRFGDLFATLKRAPESMARTIEHIPGVQRVETRVVAGVMLDVPGLDEPASGKVVSIPDRRQPMLGDLFLRRGRYVDPGRDDQVIVSEAFAEANQLEPGDAIGAVINGRRRRLTIVGIGLSPEYFFVVGTGSLFPDERRFGIVWMGRTALASVFDMTGAFNDLVLRLNPGTSRSEVIARLDHLLKPYGALGAYERADQISNHMLTDELSQLRANGYIVPAIFLGVACFLLHIVLSRLVAMQRDQVAVLKAFGYSNRQVGAHYLQFAVSTVIVGGALGAAIGIWLGRALTGVYTKYYHFPALQYLVDWKILLLVAVVCATAAVLGALVAVRRATALPPAEAMRPEPPARFRPGFIERLGIQRAIGTVPRIIIRTLERNPLKSLVSVLGIALAAGIVVTGTFSYDAITFMTDVQFRLVQREDAMILFNRPLPARALFDVRHLPGVLRAEPFRAADVRLRSGHRSRRISILGLPPANDMHRIVDRRLRQTTLAGPGLVLTSKLGELLGVRTGDSLVVELLEGHRGTRVMPVVALVDEMFGMSAYMRIDALHTMLREGGSISGAYVAVDSRHVADLHHRLKQTPAISATLFRKAAIDAVTKLLSESQSVTRIIQSLFAAIIAFGIIYNSARISLSERGRELASLRVLGFTRAEVAWVLLGEQAIITTIAIPLGFLIGYAICVLVALALEGELYRVPVVIAARTYAFAALVVIAAAGISALMVRRRLANLDLVEVLKTRE